MQSQAGRGGERGCASSTERWEVRERNGIVDVSTDRLGEGGSVGANQRHPSLLSSRPSSPYQYTSHDVFPHHDLQAGIMHNSVGLEPKDGLLLISSGICLRSDGDHSPSLNFTSKTSSPDFLPESVRPTMTDPSLVCW